MVIITIYDGYTRKLGEIGDRTYLLFIKVWPSWNDVDEFVATIDRRRIDPATGEREADQIVRIENRAHGHTHVDRLWTEDQGREPFAGEWYDAWEHLEENWRKYARRYRRNHG